MKKSNLILLPLKNDPIVHLDFALLNGSLRDPAGKEGLSSITLSMLLRGTKKKNSTEFHRQLDNLGAEIGFGKQKESMRLYASVLSENLEPLIDLIEELLTEPLFSIEEFNKVKALLRSGLLDELGSDDDIADRRFQEYILWGNAYGKMTSGSIESLEGISIEDIKAFHQKYFKGLDFIVGASGGFDKKFLEKRIRGLLNRLSGPSIGRLEAEAPQIAKGKSLILLDKPGRNQSQIIIGAPGINYSHKNYFALLLANHVFGGGSFSARLMSEVREKRGWSYGAYAFYRSGRKPLYFAMQTVPANKDTVPALQLMIKLFQDFAKKGITKEEFNFAKKSLLSQSAFLQDTNRKKLDNKVTEAVLGLPDKFYDKYRSRVKALTYAKVQRAIKTTVDPSRIFVLVLGTLPDLKKDLRALKGFKNIWQVSYEKAPSEPKNLERIIF